MTEANPIERSHSAPSMPRVLGDTNFTYGTLNPTENEIRVLVILPNTLAEPIKCQIKHINLDDHSGFIAISYAWGDPRDTVLMLLCDEEFPITRSLWGALRALKSQTSEIIVWADAVCINQSDDEERSSQVRKMTQIYSHASEVALWLGSEEDNSMVGLTLLNDLASGSYDYVKVTIADYRRRRAFGALVKLFERSYWYRLWCVQELWNAKEVMVYCGTHRAPWGRYRQVQAIFLKHTSLVHQYLPYGKSDFNSWPTILQTSGPARIPGGKGEVEISLLHALITNRDKLCRDPKDMVFAVLGILGENERSQFYDNHKIDYSLTVRELFTNVVAHHLKTSKTLDFLCASTPATNSHNLPSWVPDWTIKNRRIPMMTYDPRFSAAYPTTATECFISDKGSMLSVQGVILDTVQSIQAEVGEDSDMQTVLETFQSWRTALCAEFGYGIELHQSFCRSICLGQIADGWDLTELLHLIYFTMDSLLSFYFPDLQLDPRLEAYRANPPSLPWKSIEVYQRFLRMGLTTNRLVVTSTSIVCLGAGLAEPGDVIAVLFGCNMPVVLRKGESGNYTFVGEIYVDGYMYGKAIRGLNDGRLELQRFEIV